MVEKRMELYEKKILPLAAKAIDKLLIQSKVALDITHLITVSCTGILAPGIEFLIAEHYGLQHTEKIALNFLGCYAALKVLKQAHYIAESNPDSCILIVRGELYSLPFIHQMPMKILYPIYYFLTERLPQWFVPFSSTPVCIPIGSLEIMSK